MRIVVSIELDGDLLTAKGRIKAGHILSHIGDQLTVGDSVVSINAGLIRTGSRGVAVTLEGDEG